MNEKRRKRLAAIAERVRDCIAELEEIRNEESDAFESMPESFQNGEKGEKAQNAIEAIEQAIGDLENAESQLEESQQ